MQGLIHEVQSLMLQAGDCPPLLRLLSLGAGVQSTTLALMAAHGEIPPIHAAIFADTQSEPQAVYDHLDRLMKAELPFPIFTVSKGSLRQEIFDACAGKRGSWGRPPLVSGHWSSDDAFSLPHWSTLIAMHDPTHWMPLPAPPQKG